jgi:hypothetical protein
MVLAILLTCVSVSVQAQEGASKSQEVKSERSFVGIDPKLDADRAYAQILVNGVPLKIILDTGAGTGLVLLTETATKLGLDLKPINGQPGHYQTTVRLGGPADGTVSKSGSIRVIDGPSYSGFDGILGWNTIQDQILDLNFPKRRQTTHKSVPEEIKDWPSYPIQTSNGGAMCFLLEIDGKEQAVYFDTGSVSSVSLGPKQWESWLQKEKPDWITVQGGYSPANKDGFFVTQTAVAGQYKIGDLEMGKVIVEETFANVATDRTAKQIPYLIGVAAIQRRRVVIDGPGKRIYFGPLVEPYDSFVDINRAQATYIPKTLQDEVQTAHVIEGGVAHRAGLRDGDKVLMVNGMFTSNWMKDESVRPSNVLNDKPGTRVRLFIERDGKEFPITFKLGRSPLDPAPEQDEAE